MWHRLWNDFKEFALQGNAIAVAIGVVMGGAFTAIVNSIVANMFNPLIGFLLGGINLNNKMLVLVPGNPPPPYDTVAKATAANALFIGWGAIVNATITFLVVAIAIFIIVKIVARIAGENEPDEKSCPYCQTSIPKAATRCPACTSELGETASA